jgi:hypothetical protein
MALNIYSTLLISDEPERVFSNTGGLLSLKRRLMNGEGVEQMTCLRRWHRSGIVTLNQHLFNAVVARTQDDDFNSSFGTGRFFTKDDGSVTFL